MPERKPHSSSQPLDQRLGASVVSWRSPQQAEPIIAEQSHAQPPRPQPPVPPPNPLYLVADATSSPEYVTIETESRVVPDGAIAAGNGDVADHDAVDRDAANPPLDAGAVESSHSPSPPVERFEADLFEDEWPIADLFDPDAWSGVQVVSEHSVDDSPALDEKEPASPGDLADGAMADETADDATTDEPVTDPDATTLYRRHTAGPLTYFNYYFEEVNPGSAAASSSAAASKWTWLLGTGAVAVTVVSGLMIGDAWQKSQTPEESAPKDANATPTPGTNLTRSPSPLPQGSPAPTPAAPSVAPERLPTPPASTPNPPSGKTSSIQAPPREMLPLPRQAAIASTMPPRIAPPEMVAITPTPARSANLPPPPTELRPTVPPPAAELRPPLPPPPDMTPPPLPPPIVPVTSPAPPTVAGAPAMTGEVEGSAPPAGQTSWVRRNILQMSLAEAARRQAELAGETAPASSSDPSAGIDGDRGLPASTPLPPDRNSRSEDVSNTRSIPVPSEAAGLRRLFPEQSPDRPTGASSDRDISPFSERVPNSSPRPVAIPESAQSRVESNPADRAAPLPLQRVVGIQDFVQLPPPTPGAADSVGNGATARPVSILPLSEQAASEALGTRQIQGFAVRSLPRQDYQREWATSNKLDEASSAIAYPAFGFIDYQRQMIVVLQRATNAATPTAPLPPQTQGQLPPQS